MKVGNKNGNKNLHQVPIHPVPFCFRIDPSHLRCSINSYFTKNWIYSNEIRRFYALFEYFCDLPSSLSFSLLFDTYSLATILNINTLRFYWSPIEER